MRQLYHTTNVTKGIGYSNCGHTESLSSGVPFTMKYLLRTTYEILKVARSSKKILPLKF
jgi:hypothetical protein